MTRRLSDYIQIISGGTPSTKNKEYWNGDVGWISVEDFAGDQKYIYRTEKTITELGLKESSTKLLKTGDIIISARGTVGELGVLTKEMAFNQSCFGLRVLPNLMNQEYLYYWLKWYIPKLQHKTQGSVFKTINLSTFNMIEIDLPDLKIQEQIGLSLSTIDKCIQTGHEIVNTLETLSKLIYNYWFLDFNFPDENGKPYKASGGKMVWNEELKQEIPEGWSCLTLGSLLTETRGISYSSKTISDPKGVPMINLASFTPGTGAYKHSGLKHYSGEIPDNKLLNPYDLVICNTQQTDINPTKDIIGHAIMIPDIFNGDKVTYSHHVTKINCDDMFKPFLFKLFNSEYYHKYISGFASGTSILGLNFNGVKNFKLAFPPRKVMEDYNNIFMSLQKQQSYLMMESEELKNLRNFLLPLLMNGQVTFKDIED